MSVEVCLPCALAVWLWEECGQNKLGFSETYVPTAHVLSVIQVLDGLGDLGNSLGQLMLRAKVT